MAESDAAEIQGRERATFWVHAWRPIWWIGLLAALAFAGQPNIHHTTARAIMSRVKYDMRTVGSALEVYRIDHGRYPAPAGSATSPELPGYLVTDDGDPAADFHKLHQYVEPIPFSYWVKRLWPVFIVYWSVVAWSARAVWKRRPGPKWQSGRIGVLGIAIKASTLFAAWIFVLSVGQLAPWFEKSELPRGQIYSSFHYWTDGSQGYVLQGNGIDGQRTLLDLKQVRFDEGSAADVLRPLSGWTYDPTNGTSSAGDVFRAGLASPGPSHGTR